MAASFHESGESSLNFTRKSFSLESFGFNLSNFSFQGVVAEVDGSGTINGAPNKGSERVDRC